jgi:hypothetical protein
MRTPNPHPTIVGRIGKPLGRIDHPRDNVAAQTHARLCGFAGLPRRKPKS